MTPLLEGVGIALESLRAHKARAALTILGVEIGRASCRERVCYVV